MLVQTWSHDARIGAVRLVRHRLRLVVLFREAQRLVDRGAGGNVVPAEEIWVDGPDAGCVPRGWPRPCFERAVDLVGVQEAPGGHRPLARNEVELVVGNGAA